MLKHKDPVTPTNWVPMTTKISNAVYRQVSLITSASFSPDNRFVVTTCSDGTARLWEAATGRGLLVLRDDRWPLPSAVFGPDSRLALLAKDRDPHQPYVFQGTGKEAGRWGIGKDGPPMSNQGPQTTIASVWDVNTGKQLASIKNITRRDRWYLSFHESFLVPTQVEAIFSPDGQSVVILGAPFWPDEPENINIWASATGKKTASLPQGITRLAFAPDSRRIVTASKTVQMNKESKQNKTAQIRDAKTGRLLLELKGHDGGVLDAVFSPNGKTVATCSEDHTARIWDALSAKELRSFSLTNAYHSAEHYTPVPVLIIFVTGREITTLRGMGSVVNEVVFSPDGQWLATKASPDFNVRLWPVGLLIFSAESNRAK
jgi:WD40 repeat protein